MEDWKFLRREFIHEMYVGLRLNNFRVFSMNSKEMLSKALEKSTKSSNPGKLFCLACAKISYVVLVTSAMYLPGK